MVENALQGIEQAWMTWIPLVLPFVGSSAWAPIETPRIFFPSFSFYLTSSAYPQTDSSSDIDDAAKTCEPFLTREGMEMRLKVPAGVLLADLFCTFQCCRFPLWIEYC
jgi:hypothetical protein